MKLGIAFSGGKDSLACIELADEAGLLQDALVMWVNTGLYYAEVLETVRKVRIRCPNFLEIRTDRIGQNEAHGLPAEIVPMDWTSFGMTATGEKPVKLQSYFQCCAENISLPLMQACQDYGITHLIRGQRNAEGHKSPARNGDVVQGITFLQPIEDWSTVEVLAYLKKCMGELPEHLSLNHSSMDCYDCTAFSEQTDLQAYAAARYPAEHKIYLHRRDQVRQVLNESLKIMGAEVSWKD